MAIKQFFATNNARADDSGYSAFETLGRRVGGQYNQAGNDLEQIGRSKADVINMVGRWPFNLIELQQRAFRQANTAQQASAPGRAPVMQSGVRVVGGPSITDSQFAPRYMPDLAALNEMSAGAATLGRMVGGSQLPYMAEQRRLANAQADREQRRKYDAAAAAWQKRWDLYEKSLDKYNDNLAEETRKWAEQQLKNGGYGTEYGGGDTVMRNPTGPDYEVIPQTPYSVPEGTGGNIKVPDYVPDTTGGDYGGGDSWLYRNTIGLF